MEIRDEEDISPEDATELFSKFADVVAFMDEVAPKWKCVTCGSEAMTLYGTQDDGTDPAHVRFNFKMRTILFFRSFELHCDKCGHVYNFDIVPFMNWKAARKAL
ncbi:hypothetical protein [uncultured Methylobacterium sp.]|uniref:hypothetical protein n=1 Tax=uncultured Methylobacterium sp. TaxID=157278 RepID=UPI0035CAB302